MKNLITPTGLHIGGRWLQPGDAVPGDMADFNYEKAARKGLIEDTEGDEIRNLGADVPGVVLESEAPDADALKQTQAELGNLRAKYEGVDVAALQKAARDAQAALGKAQADLATAQAQAAKPEDLAALAEYRDVVGELLPSDFPSRKILFDNGYYTVETVKAASDEDLKTLGGIADGKLGEIRKVAPHSGES